MATFYLGCDHRIHLNLALHLLCTFQHLRPDAVGHLGIPRVKQCSLTVIRLLLLEFPFCLDLRMLSCPLYFFEVFYAAVQCLAVFHLCSSDDYIYWFPP